MKWRWVFAGLAGLVLLVAVSVFGFGYWVLRTEGGAQWVARQIDARAGNVLTLGQVSGTLDTGITIGRVEIDSPAAGIVADQLTLRVSLGGLLGRRLVVENLAAASVTYIQREASVGAISSESDADSPLASIMDIDLERVAIDAIAVSLPDVELTFGPTEFSGGLADETLRVAGLSTETSGVALDGDAEIVLADGADSAVELMWTTELDGVVWAGSGRATGTLERIAFEHRLAAPFEATAAGAVTFGDTNSAQISVEWLDVEWPGQALVTSPFGSLELAGWIDAFDFSGSGRLLVQDQAAEFVASGAATPELIAFESLGLDTAFGMAALAGSLSLPELAWDLTFDAQDLNPGDFVPEWPALLNVRGRLSGALEPSVSWALDGMTLEGSVRGEPVTASGRVESPAPDVIQLDRVEVDWSGNRAVVDGAISQQLDLLLNIDAPRLQAFSDRIGGAITLEGRLTGTRDLPALRGTLAAVSLTADDFALDRLRVDGTVAAAQEAGVDLTIAAEGFRRAEVIATSLAGRVTGTTASHQFNVELAQPIGAGAMSGSGGWNGTEWSGEIDALDLNQEILGIWSLETPARVAASADSISVERSCLRNAGSQFCLGAALGGDNERLEVSVAAFNLASLQPLLGEAITISGLYDAELELIGPRERPTGALSVRGRSTLLSVSDVETPLEVPVDAIDIDARLTETELEASAEIRAPAGARVGFTGSLTDIWTPEPRIDASIEGSWADLQFISILSPEVGDVSGAATIAVEIDGPLESPEARGEARWADGQIEVPRWGLVVRDVDVVVSSPAGNELIYAFTGVAGEGSVEVTGRTQLDPQAAWPTTFRVSGDNLAAVQLPEAQVFVSPDLEVVTDWPTVFVSGTVTIPSADLRLDEVAVQTATVSPDVVVHGGEAAAPQRPLDVRANIALVLGDDVRFSGSGLNAALNGAIDVDYRSGLDAAAAGTVTLAGNYTTLGQTLELDRGRLLFVGQVTNPRLDVRGVRRFETESGEVLVGVLVTGTVRDPVTRLYAEPSMSEGDIVSYLVIGRPISDSSRENSEALQTAALSLGLTQALPQIQHFGEAIGLDELGIRTSAANTGELMAGKQISPRVYMRYTYGLINRIGGLLLRFKLTDQLRLETRTGEFKAMDLLFTVERE